VSAPRSRATPLRFSRLNAWASRLNAGAARFGDRAHRRLLVGTGGFYSPVWLALFWLDLAAWAAVLTIDRPPRWMAAVALSVAVITWLMSMGLAMVYGREHSFASAIARMNFLGMTAEQWLLFLAPAALACSGIESWAHPERMHHPLTYVNSMLWNAADLVPLVDMPRLLHQTDPPIRTWGMTTGGLFILSDILMVGTVLVWVRELWRSTFSNESKVSAQQE
jgi:signal transduction histidine kinase